MTQHLGFAFDDSKLSLLKEVLGERLVACSLSSVQYLELLEGGSGNLRDELSELAAALTVTETYFFRNAEQIRAFQATSLASAAPCQEIRVLSAGCASGEEPYSLAMAILEQWPEARPPLVSVQGMDLNPRMLAKARAGRYSPWSLRATPEEIQARWFRQDGRESVLDPRVQSLVTIEERNLVENDEAYWAPRTFHAIFCRNVLMYLTVEHARLVVAKLARSLRPGGMLFLGYAETLRNLSQDFHLLHTHETFYYQLKEPGDRVVPSLARSPTTTGTGAPLAEALDAGLSWVEAIQRASERVLVLSRSTSERGEVVNPHSPLTGARSAPVDLGAVLHLLREERFGEALSVLGQLEPEFRRDADVLQLTATLLVHAGRRLEAQQLASELLQIDELNVGAHYVLALCNEQSGDHEAAMDHNRLAIHLDATFSMPHLHLGILAKRMNQRDVARSEFSQALDLLPREDASRLLLFGGGFGRDALLAFCHAELTTCGAPS